MNKFLAEIMEQPKSLSDTLDFYCNGKGKEILASSKEIIEKGKFENIVFTGMGSSYFISYAAACLFNSLEGLPHAFAVNASELLYYHPLVIDNKTLVVCISQSGESYEVVKLLEKLPKDVVCLGLCNVEDSVLAKETRKALLCKAGTEEMTSTKTYISSLLVAYLWGWSLTNNLNDEKISQMRRMIDSVDELLENNESLLTGKLESLGESKFIQFIGRGPSYSNALQSELMFKEAAKTASSGTLGGEFRHGPIEMVSPDFHSVMFAAVGDTYDQSINMAEDIAKFGGKVILITNGKPEIDGRNIEIIHIDTEDQYLFTVHSIIPVQLLVNSIGISNGYEPGGFIHGNKITVVE